MSDHDPYDDATRVDTPAADATMAMPAATGGQPPTGRPPTGEPPAEPPDRRPWIIGGLLAVIAVLALALLLMNDDDSEETTDTSSTTTSSTTSSSTTSTTAPTTTTTAPTTTTEAPPTTVDPARCVSSAPDDPDSSAEVVFEAYTLDDRDCASNLMTSDALDELFGIPGAGGGWTFQGCQDVEDPDPQTWCSYSFEGGSTTFRMNYSDTEGWTVFGVFQTAD